MIGGGFVLIIYDAADGAVAQQLAGDLHRQGVPTSIAARTADAIHHSAAVVALLSLASAASPSLRSGADEALRAGKLIFGVRLADLGPGSVAALDQACSWTDAFGPSAAQNVSTLANRLRPLIGPPGAPGGSAPPPPMPAMPPMPAGPGFPAPQGAGKPPVGLIATAAIVGVLVVGIGVLEATETINIFGSATPTASPERPPSSGNMTAAADATAGGSVSPPSVAAVTGSDDAAPGRPTARIIPSGGTPRQVSGSISDADYPASAIRAGASGTTRVRLQVNASGEVTGCSVTASSGNSALDSATCSLMTRRFRYEPPLSGGQAFVDTSMTWRPPTN